MAKSYIQEIIENLRAIISSEKKDLDEYEKWHFRLAGACRKYILNADKEMLSKAYSELSSLQTWFYKDGSSQWPEVERQMGGIDQLLSLMGNLKEISTAREALIHIRGSKRDSDILLALLKVDSILSGRLAEEIGLKKPNALTNRLPELEKKGLIIRSKRGKNSLIALTPKGKKVASELMEASQVANVAQVTHRQEYKDYKGPYSDLPKMGAH